MPYKLIFIYTNGTRGELGPIVPDSPKGEFGLEDRRIGRKCEQWAKRLKTCGDVEDCYVHHYLKEAEGQ